MLYPPQFYVRHYAIRNASSSVWYGNGEYFGYRVVPKYDKAKVLLAALDLYRRPAILFVISTFILRDLCHISYLLTIGSTISGFSMEYPLIFITFTSLLYYIISKYSYCNINTFTLTSRKCKSKVRMLHVRVMFLPLGYQRALHNFTTRQRCYGGWMSGAKQKVRRSLCKVSDILPTFLTKFGVNFKKIRPMESELIHAERQSEIRTKVSQKDVTKFVEVGR